MFSEAQITKGIEQAVDHLTLANYEYNRNLFPKITTARWALVYGAESILKLENAFQAKKNLTIDV